MGKVLVSIYSALSVLAMAVGIMDLFVASDIHMVYRGIGYIAGGLFLQLLSINWAIYTKETK